MRKLNSIIFFGLFVLISSFTILASSWKIDDNFRIHFAGNSVEGIFENFSGQIIFDENDLASSKFSLNIKVESISTGNWLKNRHAKNDNWFDSEKYPNIVFKSSKFSKTANGFNVKGFLKMHGIEKEIAIPFTFVNNTFKGNFSVNRIDYGIGTLEGMSKKVSNEIKIDFVVPVTKEK
ncbi:YceI family protein [Flavobacterium foetidum]|uniref:YceI family protein n=1 Tax=Flavobacterium foetidum TaxID=2026681 RepID=UPI0013C326FB|nr:YceI family protein [Flavobacterium foetidum]KAF2516669.1 YceI family protein [Flavobacterium foetidum]